MKRACEKISTNAVTCAPLDEDGLNRQVRDLLNSAIERFGYNIADQSQQGFGTSEANPGEMDMRIKKDGIPIAIYEGLIHRDRKYLYDHIKKATGRYNLSGCRTVYIVEFFREKGFGTYWDNTLESLDDYEGLDGAEEDSGLNLVKMYCGRIVCDGGYMSFILFGVNAPKHLEEENIRLA